MGRRIRRELGISTSANFTLPSSLVKANPAEIRFIMKKRKYTTTIPLRAIA
jgi:hypothetical protein